MFENHPVLIALKARLQALHEQYRSHPTEENRYRLVQHEQRLAQLNLQEPLSS